MSYIPPNIPNRTYFLVSFTRLYANTPTLNTRDKTSTDGAFPQALLAPPFVNITEFEYPKRVRYNHLRSTHQLKTKHSFSGSGLTAAACQSKLALVVSMRIRNTGESLSRPFPRLQRTRRCRGRTSHSDVKRRASKCTSFPRRTASGLPPLLPAATSISNAPSCWRCPPSRVHRYRDTSDITPTSLAATSLNVSSVSVLLRRGLPTAFAPVHITQAQSPRGPALATRASNVRAAAQPVRTSNGKCLTRTPWPGILPPAVSSAANSAICSTSYTSSPPTQPASQ
jgi:hypothetical protein